MKIRKAKEEDLRKIAEIFRREYSKFPYKGKWNKKNALEAINEHFKKYEIYVIEIDKKIVGFTVIEEITSFREKACFINEMVISSEFHRKGLGKKLMEFTENYCKKKSIKKIKLSTNRKAHAFKFYKNRGYSETLSVSMEKKLK